MRQNHDPAYRKQLGLPVRGEFDRACETEYVYISAFEEIERMGIDRFLDIHGRK